mgnify:FL=1
MKLREWTKEKPGRPIELAGLIGASPVLISQWATGKRPVPIERCVPIERATDGAVSRIDLRPDDWHEIWPELVILERNAANPSASRPPAAITSDAEQA